MSKADGIKIAIKFTEDLVGDVISNESAFTIKGQEYKYTQGLNYNGELLDKEYQVEKVERYGAPKVWELGEELKLSTESGEGYADDLTGGMTYISTSDFSSSYANYMAFDNNTSSSWSASGILNQAVGVKFNEPKNIRKLRIMTNGRLKDFALEGSNDNSNWENVYNGTQLSNSNWQEFEFENELSYLYYRVKCTSSLYTGSNVMITEIEMMELDVVYSPLSQYTTESIAQQGNFRLMWQSENPIGTNILIEYSTDNIQWQSINNGDLIDIETNLWIRATLSTTDTTVTPILKDLWLEEPDAPQDRILLTFDWWQKFNNVVGDLTIEYDATKGSLSGSGGAVESFIETFTPTDLVATPNPWVTEIVSVAPVEVVANFIPVAYHNRYAEEHISVAPVEVTATLINVSEINP